MPPPPLELCMFACLLLAAFWCLLGLLGLSWPFAPLLLLRCSPAPLSSLQLARPPLLGLSCPFLQPPFCLCALPLVLAIPLLTSHGGCPKMGLGSHPALPRLLLPILCLTTVLLPTLCFRCAAKKLGFLPPAFATAPVSLGLGWEVGRPSGSFVSTSGIFSISFVGPWTFWSQS